MVTQPKASSWINLEKAFSYWMENNSFVSTLEGDLVKCICPHFVALIQKHNNIGGWNARVHFRACALHIIMFQLSYQWEKEEKEEKNKEIKEKENQCFWKAALLAHIWSRVASKVGLTLDVKSRSLVL